MTEKCSKCNPIGKNDLKKLHVTLDFDEANFLNINSVEDLINEKIKYSKGHCPKCDYDQKGKLLKSKNLIKIVSNLKLPNIIFFNFQSDNYENLINLNIKIKEILKNKITIYSDAYFLAAIIFMPTRIHFSAEIFQLDKGINGLSTGKCYYYDGLNLYGIIELDELNYDDMINDKIIHLMIYSKLS